MLPKHAVQGWRHRDFLRIVERKCSEPLGVVARKPTPDKLWMMVRRSLKDSSDWSFSGSCLSESETSTSGVATSPVAKLLSVLRIDEVVFEAIRDEVELVDPEDFTTKTKRFGRAASSPAACKRTECKNGAIASELPPSERLCRNCLLLMVMDSLGCGLFSI